MRGEKRKRLEARGWKVGSAREFLGLPRKPPDQLPVLGRLLLEPGPEQVLGRFVLHNPGGTGGGRARVSGSARCRNKLT